MDKKTELLSFLSTYVSQERQGAFEQVLAHRTRHFSMVIEDLHREKNSSAIMRTCDCFGIQDIHVIEGEKYLRPSPLISAGASNWLDVHHYHGLENNALSCINSLKSKGYKIIATHPNSNSTILPNFDISNKSAFFLGDEHDGLSQTVLDHADIFLNIPMLGFTKSYNVSVSAAIILQQVIPFLHQSDLSWKLSEEEILDLKIKWSIKSIKRGEELVKYFQKKL